jgi:dTDP-4-amino-4,6-dideoxygalactose transaminase
LHIALAALGIQSGDEVIVPTLTFCSTANVVVHLGAASAGGCKDDFNISPEAVEAAITHSELSDHAGALRRAVV